MKTSIYINNENEQALKQACSRGKSASSVINKALELYFNAEKFESSKVSNIKGFRPCVIWMHEGVIRLLKGLMSNFDVKTVSEFVMFLVVRELDGQTNRKVFPDRLYIGYQYILRKIEKLSKVKFMQN